MSSLGELRTLAQGRGRGRTAKPKITGRENLTGYLFLSPWIVGMLVFTIGPMLASLYLSFTKYKLLKPPEWIGAKNYADMLHDPVLAHSLKVTFTYVFVGVPLQLAVALGLALLLDRGLRGMTFYRSVFYLPSLLGGSVAIAILWRQVFGKNGIVNGALSLVGIHDAPGWIGHPDYALGTLIALHVWTFGSPLIIFLAGLRQIPEMYYEAAEMDGAGKGRRFVSITVPLLTPIIFFNLVLQIIFAFQSFTQAYIVSGGTGGPSDSTMFYTLYLYRKAFVDLQMGYASAMAWLLLLIIGAFTGLMFWLSKFWVFYDD
ncbi:carbohydrate ABC transporter permease [Xylanimonas protaetiae]|uniref:Sugar ABC transporter permease n=1 Tax=Xylanimonas protaetiae TaxID=2509457 RepID=A0A4P6F2M5_9MICO|nr:sugar ABC transporter permease [Xylanimonas protaetiae]QAY68973.1 sugar ABC transporter permease [Xylanimonas protaetiae]